MDLPLSNISESEAGPPNFIQETKVDLWDRETRRRCWRKPQSLILSRLLEQRRTVDDRSRQF
jgi:hypothetical protein